MDEPSLNLEFGTRLREMRRRVGLSQDQLANAARLSRTSIVNVERGRQGVSLGTLYRLADALSCSPAQLLPARQEVEMPRIAIGSEAVSARQAVLAVLRRAQEQQ